jgi:hypothetical protein
MYRFLAAFILCMGPHAPAGNPAHHPVWAMRFAAATDNSAIDLYIGYDMHRLARARSWCPKMLGSTAHRRAD